MGRAYINLRSFGDKAEEFIFFPNIFLSVSVFWAVIICDQSAIR